MEIRIMSLGRIFDTVLLFAAISAGFVAGYSGLKLGESFSDPKSILFFVGLPATVSLLLFLSFRLAAGIRESLTISLLALGFGVYAAEAFIVLSKPDISGRLEETAAYWGIAYDGRSKLEFIEALETKTKIKTYPSVPAAAAFMEWLNDRERRSTLRLDGAELIPFGSIPNAQTVYCNEMGKWIFFDSDEHGFRNPPGLWQQVPSQIAILGDSFGQGACVRDEDHFAGKIRAQYPGTINLAGSSGGPLSELAVLSEYGPHIRPKLVLWFFFEGNDTINLLNERTYSRLIAYLKDGKPQGLYHKVGKVSQILKGAVAKLRMEEKNAAMKKENRTKLKDFSNIVLLRNVRRAIGIRGFFSSSYARLSPEDRGLSRLEILQRDELLLSKIFTRAKTIVKRWDGELVLVYLPAWRRGRYIETGPTPYYTKVREVMGRVTEKLHIPVIDLIPAFNNHPKPKSLNAHQAANSGHYSPIGYGLVADTVLKDIRQRLPTK